ncbi:Fructose-1-phosphate phosphatase YqaB [Roseibium album]|nr:Fructose-1-phosphate phosphatase YqaB [Roseibium album]
MTNVTACQTLLKVQELPDLENLLTDAQALIFDCDGTLVETPAVYAKAWQTAFAEAGQDMEPAWYHERAGMSEHVLLDAFEMMRGVKLDRQHVVQVMRRSALQGMEQVTEISLIADIARRFRSLKPMAVASGGPEVVVMSSLRASRLLPLFDTVVTLDAVEKAKPAPDLFLEAATRLGVDPAGCLVFEDSPQGVEAAHAAGMPVIDVNDLIGATPISA